MKLKYRQVPFKVKSVEKDGAFEGYLSIFGNTDQYRDVVMPGAFTATLQDWKAQDMLPPVLWQHKSAQPIGPFTKMSEDATGLLVEGLLLIEDVQQAREAHALLKAKAIRGMSIGYVPTDEEYDGQTNVNKLLAVDLWEGSIVTFPANVDAMVTEIKSILANGELPSLSEFEDFLREAGNFSRSQAKAVAGHGLVRLLEQRDADKKQVDDVDVDSILALFREHPIKL